MCEVINITNHRTTPFYDIYIGYAASWGEAGKWGNQFDVAEDLYLVAAGLTVIHTPTGEVKSGDILDVDFSILLYREWLLHSSEGLHLQEDIDELRGKVLGCFCKPRPCHGDVLVELLGQREEIDDEP